MAGRVTIQDIADALGVSRNTVSKAINNTGVLAEKTREKILHKAVEMGYKQFSYISMENLRPSLSNDVKAVLPENNGIIALLTTTQLGYSHFSSTMLDKFQRELSQAGYSLTVYRITPEEVAAQRLPAAFQPDKTDAVMCIEVFDPAYSEFLTTLSIPVLFVDGPVMPDGRKLQADMLLMNNRTEICTFVSEMYARGKRTFGYIGHSRHCLSFWERFLALKEGLALCGLPYNPEYSIDGIDPSIKISSPVDYQNYLGQELDKMSSLPEVFVCANDFVAFDLLHECRKRGLNVPTDFYLCGFDDSPESRVTTPTLTTIHIHSQIMGGSATQMLLTRFKNPDQHYRTVYTETSLIYRESTDF